MLKPVSNVVAECRKIMHILRKFYPKCWHLREKIFSWSLLKTKCMGKGKIDRLKNNDDFKTGLDLKYEDERAGRRDGKWMIREWLTIKSRIRLLNNHHWWCSVSLSVTQSYCAQQVYAKMSGKFATRIFRCLTKSFLSWMFLYTWYLLTKISCILIGSWKWMMRMWLTFESRKRRHW